MARASTNTLLSLDRFAKLLGINPAHFNQAYAGSVNPIVFPVESTCSEIWFQYDWQSSQIISREGLARAIESAEEDIATEMGFYPAPKWFAQDVYRYPKFYNPQISRFSYTSRGQAKSIILRNGKFLQGGRREVTLIGTATVAGATLVYSDEDGDGLEETATITLATTLTNSCEIKAYFAGNNGDQIWEIKPPKSISIAGGFVTIIFDSWLLIDPDLWEMFPNSNEEPSLIDISTTANFVTSVEVYREFTDFSLASSQFLWENCTTCGGSGCVACQLTTQDGCLQVRNIDISEVVPIPATYDVTQEQWNPTSLASWQNPTLVKTWYKAGLCSNDFLRGVTCDPLSKFWAETIAWLAVAKLEKPFCSCHATDAQVKWLQTDLAETSTDTSFFLDANLSANPWGTRRGAIVAWQRTQQAKNKENNYSLFAV